jgi:hypothetical protein
MDVDINHVDVSWLMTQTPMGTGWPSFVGSVIDGADPLGDEDRSSEDLLLEVAQDEEEMSGSGTRSAGTRVWVDLDLRRELHQLFDCFCQSACSC